MTFFVRSLYSRSKGFFPCICFYVGKTNTRAILIEITDVIYDEFISQNNKRENYNIRKFISSFCELVDPCKSKDVNRMINSVSVRDDLLDSMLLIIDRFYPEIVRWDRDISNAFVHLFRLIVAFHRFYPDQAIVEIYKP